MDRSREWHEERRKYIGGSDANIILSGDRDAVHDLWLVKTGQREPEDLTWSLPVQIGRVTENLNIRFYEHATGRVVSARNMPIKTFGHDFMSCEVDGITVTEPGILVEAKHVSGYSDIEAVVQRYMPQLHHNMICTGLRLADLSVIRDNNQHKIFSVEYDPFYATDLVIAEAAFWEAVQKKEPPDPSMIPVPPAPVDKTIVIDMTGNNAWADQAAAWIENEPAKKKFDTAAKELKALVKPEAGKTHGHGIIISRAKDGKLTIKAGEHKE